MCCKQQSKQPFSVDPRTNKKSRGFSLVEVMVVVVIIGMLAGAVTIAVGGHLETAKTNRAKSDIATIVDAVEAFRLTKGRYPTSEEGLEPLPLKNGLDPWGRPYGYNTNGAQGEPFEVYTLGADGRDGGEDADADIYSWQLGDTEEVSE